MMVVMIMAMPVTVAVVMMIMVMVVIVVVMMVIMVMMIMPHLQPAFASAEGGAKIAIFDIAARRRNAFALDMMMVAFLRQPHFVFKPQHLRAVFAHRAIHIVVARQNFLHAIGKGRDHIIMVIEVTRFDKFDLRVARGNLIGEAVYAVD